jgi:outer membrane protein OmpA-like peptidoglycan-associated protein
MATLMAACAKKEEPVQKAVTQEKLSQDDGEWRYTIVDFDPSLVKNCGITTTETYFKYDSAKLNESGERMVDGIAECVTDGPLKGAELVVVGSTDPQGTDQYNERLGMSRQVRVELAPDTIAVEQGVIETDESKDEGKDEGKDANAY